MSEVKEAVEQFVESEVESAKKVDERVEITKKLAEDGVPQLEFDRKPFAALVKSDDDLRRVFETLEGVIWRSFAEDVRRNPFGYTKPTVSEVKRRFKICENWIRHARGDVGYSLEQTLDLMGHALRAELDGKAFDPPKPGSRIWTPT
jgi:hypothetical protein